MNAKPSDKLLTIPSFHTDEPDIFSCVEEDLPRNARTKMVLTQCCIRNKYPQLKLSWLPPPPEVPRLESEISQSISSMKES